MAEMVNREGRTKESINFLVYSSFPTNCVSKMGLKQILYFAEPLLFLMLSYQSVSLICLIYQREAQIQLLGSFQVFALDRQITQNCFAVDFSYISPTT